ncbi:D-xylose-proton symporter-like 1 [Glycine soja]|uniref:D-xylose-proton symporter-like 1 n=1 Tax=Glycine soja TaxID=3848 RepID=UPI00103D0D7C|nr:D-xylose-proton symporter-like 1 [Glycine soja]
MVEIYMEKVRDLFDLSKDNIQIKEIKSRGIILPGVTEAMHAAPMYIAETAPTPIHGQLKSLKEFFIVLGMVVSSIIFVYLAVSTGFTYATTEFATQRRTGY